MNKIYSLAYNKDVINDKFLNAAIGVAFFILATALGAYIRIPIKGNPVPITLQTFFVILSGAILGKRLGAYSQLGYILLGALGLPIFQGCAFGILHILGPTGGYLIGFAFSAYFIGRALSSGISSKSFVMASFIVGDLLIHSLGAIWLVIIYKMNIFTAVSMGILPFIPGEIIKISAATLIYSKVSKRSKGIFAA